MSVNPATFARPEGESDSPVFVPAGEYHPRPAGCDYVDAEWFAAGVDDAAHPYMTQVYVRLPRDPARFSGTVIVEPLHEARIAPIFLYSSPYVLRSGHGWACVASQKSALDAHVKPTDPSRYGPLDIGSDSPRPTASRPSAARRDGGLEGNDDFLGQLLRYNHASNAILAQVGAAVAMRQGPFDRLDVRYVLLVGHSQTGSLVTDFMLHAHESHRLADGSPIFDGYFPSGFPSLALGRLDVPVVQLLSDGDILNPHFAFRPGLEGRQYRRPDSDEPNDRYRLYELAGVPHMGTRYPPHNDADFWVQFGDTPGINPDSVMNSLPHNELFNMALDHLVQWVATGKSPPSAERIQVGPDGFFAKDRHGNTLGGVRCAQMDIPRATYHSLAPPPGGEYGFGTVGIEIPFDRSKLSELYLDHDDYVRRFNLRLDELMAEGWFLPQDADDMHREASAANVP